MNQDICRIAIFYDGHYFTKISNYYFYSDDRKTRIFIPGLHDFIVDEVAKAETIDKRRCQVVDASFFRGRLTTQQAYERDQLYSDRLLEDALIRADVTLYQRHLSVREGMLEEKSIDVWLALEAFQMTALKKYDVCVLITGDGDFVPLVRKLNAIGSRVMLMAWDLEYQYEGRARYIRTSQALIDQVNYPVIMSDIIDSRDRKNDPIVNGIFTWPKPAESKLRRNDYHLELPPVAENGKDDKEDQDRKDHKTAQETGHLEPAATADNMPAAIRLHGVIDKIPRKYEDGITKRYGFIRPDGTLSREDNYYFPAAAFEGGDFDALEEGMAVEFEPIPNYYGRKIARRVRAHGGANGSGPA
jgi:uncharacterized LabA/DUF88 family protein/cold shock CspA family protein